MKTVGSSEFKQEKILKFLNKGDFLDMLKGKSPKGKTADVSQSKITFHFTNGQYRVNTHILPSTQFKMQVKAKITVINPFTTGGNIPQSTGP